MGTWTMLAQAAVRVTEARAKKFIGKKLASWYPNDILDPIVVARIQQERLSEREMLKRRGKGRGRRAAKRKTW